MCDKIINSIYIYIYYKYEREKNMNVKKLVYLCISVALLVVSLVFSVDGSSVSAEFEANKSETLAEVTDLSDLVSNLPSSKVYYSSEEAASENFKSVTMVEESELNDENSGYQLNRILTIYFTEKGAYYQSKGVQKQRTNSENGVFTITTLFDVEIWIAQGQVFIKYNKYEVDTPKGVEIDEMQVLMFDTVKQNYGKWIDLTYQGTEIDSENPEQYENMTEEEQIELGKQMLIKQTSIALIEQFININDKNVESLQKLVTIVSTNLDKFEKVENSYTLMEEHRDILSAYMGSGMTGQFNVNLNAPTTPRMSFNSNDLKYIVTFKNIGNTNVNVPENIKYGIDDFLGEYFDQLIAREMEGEN